MASQQLRNFGPEMRKRPNDLIVVSIANKQSFSPEITLRNFLEKYIVMSNNFKKLVTC